MAEAAAIVQSIPCVGPRYFERLLRNLRNVKAVFNASQSQLTQADIPPATARKIQRLLNTHTSRPEQEGKSRWRNTHE